MLISSYAHHGLTVSPLRMQELPGEEGVFVLVNDDGQLMDKVCRQMASVPTLTALEHDVKTANGFDSKVRVPAWEEATDTQMFKFLGGVRGQPLLLRV